MKAEARILQVDCPPGHAVEVTIVVTSFASAVAPEGRFREQEEALIEWVRTHFNKTFELDLGKPVNRVEAEQDRNAIVDIAKLVGAYPSVHPSNLVSMVQAKIEELRKGPTV